MYTLNKNTPKFYLSKSLHVGICFVQSKCMYKFIHSKKKRKKNRAGFYTVASPSPLTLSMLSRTGNIFSQIDIPYCLECE